MKYTSKVKKYESFTKVKPYEANIEVDKVESELNKMIGGKNADSY